MSIYLNVSELPTSISMAVRTLVGANKSIQVVAATEIEVGCSVCYQGNRSVHISINALTGEYKEHFGTWGGSTAFVPSSLHSSMQQIPENGAVISGETGYKTIITLYVHPSLLDRLQLEAAPNLSDEILTMLYCIGCYKPGARPQEVASFAELGEYVSSNPILISMVNHELIKVNKAGSIQLTNKGRGLVPRHPPLKASRIF